MRVLAAVLILVVSAIANANDGEALPFTPRFAADQAQINSRSILEEIEQFRAIAKWENGRGELKTAKLKYEQAKREFERAKSLRDGGHLAETKFGLMFFEFRKIEDEIIRLPMEIVKAKAAAQFHMLRLLEEGNPGVDHKEEIATLVVDGLKVEIATLKSSLGLAQTAVGLTKPYYEKGVQLVKENALSEEQLERRGLAYRSAENQVEAISKQIKLTEMALASFENAKRRVKP
jgi:multidrug resistance efflux pump